MSIFPTTIVLATDGSGEAELARVTAVDMASSTDSELHLVTVAPGFPPYDGYRSHDTRIPEVVEQLRQQAEKILDEQTQKIKRDGGKVAQQHLKIADPIAARHRAQQILRVAEEIGAGLIVMGSRGCGGVRRALIGSVSDSVVRHARCPVVVAGSQETEDKRKGDPQPGSPPWGTEKTRSAWSGMRWAMERGRRTY